MDKKLISLVTPCYNEEGNITKVYEQVKNGAMVMTIADFGYLADYEPDIGIIAGPTYYPMLVILINS